MEIANLTPQKFEEAQKDSSLDPLWRAAEDGADGYFIKGQRLYHLGEDEWGEDTAQLVIPTKFRHDILTMAHGTRLAAHLGVNKSTKKAYHYFFWPGLRKDMHAFCQTCGACQHGAKANRTKAPLQPLPAIDEPFQRVAVDIVGPLKRTKRGNRYILMLMEDTLRLSLYAELMRRQSPMPCAPPSHGSGYHRRSSLIRALSSCALLQNG